jgi:hypothetical protein
VKYLPSLNRKESLQLSQYIGLAAANVTTKDEMPVFLVKGMTESGKGGDLIYTDAPDVLGAFVLLAHQTGSRYGNAVSVQESSSTSIAGLLL